MASVNFELNAISINELSIIVPTDKGNEKLPIRGIMEQIDIYENIVSPVIMGSIVVIDTIGISKALSTGSCYLYMNLSKDDKNKNLLKYEKTFRIYKQEKRQSKSARSEAYIFYFCSDELISSEQTRVSKSYDDTYSSVAENILKKYLKVNNDKISVSKSKGIKHIVVPSLKPLDALVWCAHRAVNDKNIPDFLFFENKFGFNFASLSSLFKTTPVDLHFSVKNIAEGSNDPQNLFGVKTSEVVSQFNLLESVKKGTYASSIYGFDLITRSFFKKNVNNSYYDKTENLNKNKSVPVSQNGIDTSKANDSKRTLLVTDSLYNQSSYAKKNAPNSNLHSPEYSLAHKTAVLSFLSNKKMKVLLPGNFSLTVGMIANLKYPKKGNLEKGKELDYSFSGKHMIFAVRHLITPQVHETILEVTANSDAGESDV